MSYQELSEIPAYERFVPGTLASDGKFLWGSDTPPPAIGAEIIITMNQCGPAIVTGYFTEDGFLGVLCTLTNPPAWHVKQNKGNPKGHVFGPEFRGLTAKEHTQKIVEATEAAAEALRYFDGRVYNGFGELSDPSLAWGELRDAQRQIKLAIEAHNLAEKAGWTTEETE